MSGLDAQIPATFDNDLRSEMNTYDDAIVVRADINNYEVDRVLIATGSSVNVMFFDLIEMIGLNSQDFRPSRGPLVGCFGEKKDPEGEITVPVTWGDAQHYATFHVDFVVLRAQSPYNCFFGRPLLNQFGAIASTYHMMVKFPTPFGVAQVRADLNQPRQRFLMSSTIIQIIPEECSNIAPGRAVDKVTTKGGVDRTFQINGQLQGKTYTERESKAEGFKEEFQMLKSGMDAVASAINRCAPHVIITEQQLYEEVQKIDGLSELSQIIAYDFLCGDATRGKTFIGLPLARKKLWLEFKLGHPLE